MGTYLFRIKVSQNNISPFLATLKTIKYKVKQMGGQSYSKNNTENNKVTLNFTVTMPWGKTHYKNCVDIIDQFGGDLIDGKPGTQISIRKREKFIEFLAERWKDAVAIYLGTIVAVMGTLEIANHYAHTVNDNGEPISLMLKIGAEYWLLTILLAAAPSVVHMFYHQKLFRKKYGNDSSET